MTSTEIINMEYKLHDPAQGLIMWSINGSKKLGV